MKPIFVEDLIHRLACNGVYMFSGIIQLQIRDRNFVVSLSNQIFSNRGLTFKQKNSALSVIKKYSTLLSSELNIDINAYLSNPQYKLEERVLSTEKQIKIVKDTDGISYIHVIFPYNDTIINSFRNYKTSTPVYAYRTGYWDQELHLWKFSLTEHNILFLGNLQGFEKDSKFSEYYAELLKIQESIETYVPMVVKNDLGKYIFKNEHRTIPKNSYDNLVDALLAAKKFGISCWSDVVNDELDKNVHNNLLKNFLNSDKLNHVVSKNRTIELDELTEIICAYDKILFVIPGGHEIKYLTKSYEFLKKIGFASKDCSVMFRLEKQYDLQSCNKFIHDNSLNNPVDENTKFVFISVKVPKPMIESNIEFDLIINFGLTSSHFTLQQFIKTHHNVICINPLSNTEGKHYVYV
jgi:hypothetical protein